MSSEDSGYRKLRENNSIQSYQSSDAKKHQRENATEENAEEKMRRELKNFFVIPFSKWKDNKCYVGLHVAAFILQFIKLGFITAQVVIFAGQRSDTVDYFERNELALKHIFLKDWQTAYETMPYPPAVGNYAVYTKQNLIEHIDHMMQQYYRIPEIAIGTFFWEKNDMNGTESVPPPIQMCKTSYKEVSIFENKTFILDPEFHTDCFPIEPIVYENKTVSYDIVTFLREENRTILFNSLTKIELKVTFRSYHLDLVTRHTGAACFKTEVNVLFDNNQRNGQTLIDLQTQIFEIECNGRILSKDAEAKERIRNRGFIALDSITMVILTVSTVFCIKFLIRGYQLRKNTVKFFRDHLKKPLSKIDQLEFLNLWYVLIIINDMLTFVGSCFKIMLESKNFSSVSKNLDVCSTLLGTGYLLAWCGGLRYLGFCAKCNILIVTFKTAFCDLLTFAVNAVILYIGFMGCGWVILGPHNIKFRELSSSVECLFALVNGDDMFVTFSATQTNNVLVWYISRIYLYTFISLFIYTVLSLFISVYTGTYDTIKEYRLYGFPKSDLFKFIEKCSDSDSDRSWLPCFEDKKEKQTVEMKIQKKNEKEKQIVEMEFRMKKRKGYIIQIDSESQTEDRVENQ